MINDESEAMINYEHINEVVRGLIQVEPDIWLEEQGIAPEAMLTLVEAKTKATALMVFLSGGGDEEAVKALEATIAATFQLGWESHKQLAPAAATVTMLEHALQVAERTTTMGNALADALNVAVDALQKGTDADAALDQCHAILTNGYAEAYPE